MSTSQILQSAQNGATWSRRVGNITYFLRKVNNRYEVWTSAASTARSTVTLDQAVTFYNQHDLVNVNNTASPAPRNTPPPTPTPTPSPTPRPSPTPVSEPTPAGPSPEFLEAFADFANTPETVNQEPSSTGLAGASSTFDDALAAYAAGPATVTQDPGADPTATPDSDFGQSEYLPEETIAVTAAPVETVAVEQDQIAFQGKKDWRVRLSLSEDPSCNYLYRADPPGILAPLRETDGVLFPYTPQINVTYAANYSPTEIVHSNYKQYQYSSSSVDSVTITCDFTAQDTYEANYLLAVIHFFRSMTKMFYGQDENPRRGTPPPLCYLFGMGNYQFAAHPLAISGFTYNLPNNVDYIKTISPSVAGVTLEVNKSGTAGNPRLAGTNAAKGGTYPPVSTYNTFEYTGEEGTVSWVPTKIQLSITCVPMMSRNQISNVFSLRDYATGSLLNGIGKQGGGIW